MPKEATFVKYILPKPRVVRRSWYPEAVQPEDQVEELRILYEDGTEVRVPAEKFRRAP